MLPHLRVSLYPDVGSVVDACLFLDIKACICGLLDRSGSEVFIIIVSDIYVLCTLTISAYCNYGLLEIGR